MPKVTRNSAAAKARLMRKARPVFGDVSNNGKGGKNAAGKEKLSTTGRTAGRRHGSCRSKGSLSDESRYQAECLSNNKRGTTRKSPPAAARIEKAPQSSGLQDAPGDPKAGTRQCSCVSKCSCLDASRCQAEAIPNSKMAKSASSSAVLEVEEAPMIDHATGKQHILRLSVGFLLDQSRNNAGIHKDSKIRKTPTSAVLEVEEVEEPAASALLDMEDLKCSVGAIDRRSSTRLSGVGLPDVAVNQSHATFSGGCIKQEAASAVLEVEVAPTILTTHRGSFRLSISAGSMKVEPAPGMASMASKLAQKALNNEQAKAGQVKKSGRRSRAKGGKAQSTAAADENENAGKPESVDGTKPVAIQMRRSTRTSKSGKPVDTTRYTAPRIIQPEGSKPDGENGTVAKADELGNEFNKADAALSRKTRASSSGGANQHQPDQRASSTSVVEVEEETRPDAIKTEEPINAMPERKTRASSRSKITQQPRAAKSTRRSTKIVDKKEAIATELDSNGSKRRMRDSWATTTNPDTEPTAVTNESARTETCNDDASQKRPRDEDEALKPRKSARTTESLSSPITNLQSPTPCCDFVLKDDFRLCRGNPPHLHFDATRFTRGIAPVDQANIGKVEEVPEYVTDIMQRLFARELESRPHPYMDNQPELNASMRSILVDWLVEVHMKFRLEQCTLYLCVNVIDRYLRLVKVKRARLQLVGVTALLLACKVEEIYPPEIQDCVYICDRAYTSEDILEMEGEILSALQYKMSVPTGYPFLVRFQHITKASALQKIAASYYMERMLQEYSYLKHRPSLVAAGAVTLALNNPSIRRYEGITGPRPGVPKELQDYTGYDARKISEVAERICHKVKKTQYTSSRRELFAVRRKYESARFSHVSTDFADPDVRHILGAYTVQQSDRLCDQGYM